MVNQFRVHQLQAESAEAAAEWIKLLQDTANRVDFSPSQVPGAGSRRGSQEPTPAPGAPLLYSDTLEKESSGAEAPEDAGEVQEGAEEAKGGGDVCGALKTVRL